MQTNTTHPLAQRARAARITAAQRRKHEHNLRAMAQVAGLRTDANGRLRDLHTGRFTTVSHLSDAA